MDEMEIQVEMVLRESRESQERLVILVLEDRKEQG